MNIWVYVCAHDFHLHIGVGSSVVCSAELGNAKASKTWDRQQVRFPRFFVCRRRNKYKQSTLGGDGGEKLEENIDGMNAYKKIFVKLALFAGYLLFVGFSAYFTAKSLSLSLLEGKGMWFIFVLVLVVAILAGWCLTNVIKELTNPLNPSKVRLLFNFLGFLVFWVFSFTTNVHFFFVERHGYDILVAELTGAKTYIVDNTTKSNKLIDDQMNAAKMAITAQVNTNADAFGREIQNTIVGHYGFADACISILKSTENALNMDKDLYDDHNDYVIFDDVKDMGDRGTTSSASVRALQTKYDARMLDQLNKKLAVIENYYERQKDQNAELIALLDPINELEAKHLPEVQKDGTVDAFYTYYRIQNGRVISKMPIDYKDSTMELKDGKIAKFLVYPSGRMFDTMSVWGDLLHRRLMNMTMIQWIIIALIFDIVSFILFALFRRV